MKLLDLNELLANNPYPGRGLVLGVNDAHAVIAYFIMGRSENSRNRVFTPVGNGIITEAFDPSKMVDPSLIIYAPVRVLDAHTTIVTNGDQTDTILSFLQAGQTFEEALRTRTFEPDAPNFTPRVSGVLTVENGKAAYKLAILKSNDGDPESVQRFFYEYPHPKAGEGHFLHTYRCDGAPIPSFEGEPERVKLAGDIDAFANGLWSSLDSQNKVSLFVRYIDLQTGETSTRILNARA